MSKAKVCAICDDTQAVHEKTCECICHLGEPAEVTSQWNVPDSVLVELMDSQPSD